MLPAASWNRLMNNLSEHFGTDASLDSATLKEISSWLDAHAGPRKAGRETPREDRITLSAWFVREHREIAAAVWKRPSVGRASNCAACHTTAAEGRFGERDIRIPK
jgi:phage-related protein